MLIFYASKYWKSLVGLLLTDGQYEDAMYFGSVINAPNNPHTIIVLRRSEIG